MFLVAGLAGAALASPVYLQSDGKKRGSMAFARATAVKRRVHISDAFMVTILQAVELWQTAAGRSEQKMRYGRT